MSFLAELRRRNVIRMAGLYLVGAWLVTQVAATVLPLFDAPEWMARSVVVLLAIGFVPALVIAWVFELTPEGLKRDAEVAPGQSIAPQTARRMDRMLLLVMALALGYFAFDKFVLSARPQAPVAAADSPALPAATTTTGKDIVRGVAVLPFDNLSPDPDNAFFAGGIHEEVLTKLSRIGELRVISRTSMERIAKEGLEVSAISQRLGVSHVLEGSVRRAGDQVRVTVQLIDAATDNHVWAENYDRKLDDVFAIQSEIAIAIAGQLEISLSPKVQANLGDRPTKNQVAYDLYLRAIEERRVWRGAATFPVMIALLEPAVAADPDFLQARMRLADAYGRMYWFGEDPDNRFVDLARNLVADIEQRWPGRPDSLLAQAQLLYNVDRNYAAALEKFRAAEMELPGNTEVLRGISSSLKRLGRNEEFLVATRRLHALDPEVPVTYTETMFALHALGRYDEEIALGEQAVRKFPEDESNAYWLAAAKLNQRGDINAMLDYGRRFSSHSETNAPGMVAMARFVTGDIEGALAVRAERRGANPITNARLDAEQADLLQLVGRSSEAQALAARAFDVVKAAIAEGRPAPRGQVAAWYADAGAIAALAGDREMAAGWAREANAAPVASLEEQTRLAEYLADLWRFLGDPEAAWRSKATTIDALNGTPQGTLRAFKSYYDKLYGQSPSYRAYMASLVAEKQ
ncbi:MAG: hypothetical protein KA505_01625 [Xanthomonadales bacterium]|nr:hypothetical protein [Xanthomonadales bacterium]